MSTSFGPLDLPDLRAGVEKLLELDEVAEGVASVGSQEADAIASRIAHRRDILAKINRMEAEFLGSVTAKRD